MKFTPGQDNTARDLGAAAFITLCVIIYFSPVFFLPESFFIGDIFTQFYPWKDFLRRCVETGVTPYWNPSVFSGVPFLADIQKGGFYPLGLVFLLLNFAPAFKIYIALHFIIMGVSMYFLLKHLEFSRVPSIVGTLIFLFNTFTVTRINFLSALGAFAWMPLILLSFSMFLKTKKTVYWPLFVLFCALCVLAGHPPTVVYTALLVFAYWLYINLSDRSSFTVSRIINAMFFLFISLAAIFMLSMPQAGMFMELLKLSSRGQSFEYNIAAETSMAFTNMWSMLMPAGLNGFKTNFLRDWILYSMGIMNFFSVSAVFLLVLSFFYPKSRLYTFSLTLAGVSLLLALGKNTPVHAWFFTFLPYFSMLRHPGFAMTLFIIPASIMAAFTVQHINSFTPARAPFIDRFRYMHGISRRVFRLIFYTLCAICALTLLVVINREVVMKTYGLGPKTFSNFIFGLFSFLAIFGFNFALFYFKDKGKISPAFYSCTLIFSIFFELIYFTFGVNPVLPEKIYSPDYKPATVSLLRTSNYKFIHTEAANSANMTGGKTPLEAEYAFLNKIPSNTGIVYGLNDAGGYNPVQPKAYTEFLDSVIQGDSVLDREKLNLLNVKYLVSLSDPGIADFEKIYDNGIMIFKNPKALPMFFTSGGKDKLDLIIGQYSWSRRKELDYTFFKISANIEKDGYFIFSNNYYPGWTVYVDNRTAVIEKCFDIFMGVKVTKGQHEVTFKYSPTHLRDYIMLYGVMAFALLFLGVGVVILSLKPEVKLQ